VIGTNPFGTCDSECHLKVEIPDGLMRPEFRSGLDDIQTSESEMLRLDVKVEAIPEPEIAWFRDGVELHHSDRFRLMFDDPYKHYSLVIMDAYKEDTGKYRCVASNSVGKAFSECQVTIQGK
jgi:hypothetical protein